MKTTVRRTIASLLIVSTTSLGMPLPAQAGTVSTEEAIAVKRDRIAAVLERSDVRAALEARGVSSSDAKARVEAMTDEEVAQVASRIDALPAGGNPIAAIALAGAAAMQAAIVVAAIVIAVIVGAARHSSKKYPPQPSNDKPANDVSPFPRG